MENEENTRLDRVSRMPMYKEKHKLRMFSEKEAKFIENEKAEQIARKMLSAKEPMVKIAEYTELSIEKLEKMAKRYNKKK